MTDFSALSARLASYLEAASVPCLALGIVRDGSLIHGEGFGKTADGDPVTVDTLFPSCSTGKVLTATAVMKLVESNLLDLDQPIDERIPDLTFPQGGDVTRVTLRNLLSHTSGLSSDPEISALFHEAAPDALSRHIEEEIPRLRALPPGDVLVYSNPGFNIAGYLAALAARQSFSSLIHDVVCAPLGMASTSYDPAHPSSHEINATLPEDHRDNRLPNGYPAGGAVTTVRDLAQLAICHLNGGAPVLKTHSTDLMHTVHADAYTRPPRYYGFGFDIEHHRGRKLVTHGGGGSGCGSTFALVPEEGIAVIALFNHPAGHGVRSRDILDAIWEESGTAPATASPGAEIPVGDFQLAWPDLPGYPIDVKVTGDAGTPTLTVDGERSRLEHFEDSIWVTNDGRSSIGFVPGGRYAMLDFYGIGLVSALPYVRVG